MTKKLLLLILFFIFNHSLAWSQGRYIKTTTPCNKELLLKTPGRWMPINHFTWDKIAKPEEQEILKRLDAIQKLAFTAYPEPMAYDAIQGYALYKKDFASQLKLERTDYGINRNDVNGVSTISYEYFVKFCEYFCSQQDSYKMFRGAGCETGTTFTVTVNTFESFYFNNQFDDETAAIMRIENRPIKQMAYLVGKWQGYDFYNHHGVYSPLVLLHREGELPYIPVTRKQYLDRCIKALQITLNKSIIPFEKREGLQLLMKKEEWDAQTKKMEKFRDDVLKYYRDELESTTRAGLLDTPAILASDFMNILTTEPIFSKKAVGGQMVVTENPTYFKKDLPKYIPQLIVVNLYDENNGPDPNLNPFKFYDKKFPLEKLQAMIDK